MFEVDRRINDKQVVFELSGQLDTPSAAKLDAAVRPYFDTAHDIVFDIADLVYISSSGLRILLSTHKAMELCDGSVKIIHTSSAVRSIFDVTGFSDILDIS